MQLSFFLLFPAILAAKIMRNYGRKWNGNGEREIKSLKQRESHEKEIHLDRWGK